MRGKTTENHRVDGTQTHAGQHGKSGFGDHGHVNQHTVALDHPQILQDGGHALDFGMEFSEGVGSLLVGLGRDIDQRGLVAALGQMAVHRVVAQIGLAADKPFRERRVAVVANLLRLDLPVHQFGLLGPKCVTIMDRSGVEISKVAHECLLNIRH